LKSGATTSRDRLFAAVFADSISRASLSEFGSRSEIASTAPIAGGSVLAKCWGMLDSTVLFLVVFLPAKRSGSESMAACPSAGRVDPRTAWLAEAVTDSKDSTKDSSDR
jgi:hypothetical protein